MELQKQIEKVLEYQVRPLLRSHGGDVCLRDWNGGVVYISLSGACAGCPSADLSTKQFIEDVLCGGIPEVERVEIDRVTDPDLLAYARRILGYE